jgi:hypothetical protein
MLPFDKGEAYAFCNRSLTRRRTGDRRGRHGQRRTRDRVVSASDGFLAFRMLYAGPTRTAAEIAAQRQITTQVGPSELFCTPVMKKLQPGVSPLPVPPPADHLTCYAITGPATNHLVLAENQLQRQQLQLGTPALLCVPTHKKLIH